MDDEPRAPWDRRDDEPARNYAAFRLFRDLGPLRKLEDVAAIGVTPRCIRQWSYDWDWPARAVAWDDVVHAEEDRQRLESLRDMHRLHQQAGRAALELAVEAFGNIDPTEISPSAAARLLELGARLERDTLTVSVEDLQGASGSTKDDPWEKLAQELVDASSPAEHG